MENLKVNDWCFFEFKLVQVKETDGPRVTSVTDGMFNTYGSNLSDRCFPFEMGIKKISDVVAYWADKMLKEERLKYLNHPDIHRKLVEFWIGMCESDDNKRQVIGEKLSNFCTSILNRVNSISEEYIEGIKLLR